VCKFLSALVLRNGDIYTRPEATDSHEDLIEDLGFKDDGSDGFVRVEFVPPPDRNIVDPNAWKFRLDQERPSWFSQQDEERAIDKLRRRVANMLVSDKRKILLGGCWILHGDAVVSRAHSARIVMMLGSSQVGVMHGSSQVGVMHESSRVGEMHESSRVGEMHDSSQVSAMYNNSQVGKMRGSSQVVYDIRDKKNDETTQIPTTP
jgi:hypothetical protein